MFAKYVPIIAMAMILFFGCSENSVSPKLPDTDEVTVPSWLLGSFYGVYDYGYELEKIYDPTIISNVNGKIKVDLKERYYNGFQDTYTLKYVNNRYFLLHDNPPVIAPPCNSDTVWIFNDNPKYIKLKSQHTYSKSFYLYY